MTRAERACRWLPIEVLQLILRLPGRRALWSAAYFELWKRGVEDEIAATANAESGPWPCVMPRGFH